ncbi:MAG TPA: iron-sulfur cluster assembly protein, partial [Candidatus Limnocylindrales bacterium]|nr:iron-sulfur cluster assembly protein [Candidatus Limnocylindrales bacterium]
MVTKEQVYEALQECYDPEIPVNIVDLGLVYGVEVTDDKVAVIMTLTAPGCGMGTMIAADARQKILAIDGDPSVQGKNRNLANTHIIFHG